MGNPQCLVSSTFVWPLLHCHTVKTDRTLDSTIDDTDMVCVVVSGVVAVVEALPTPKPALTYQQHRYEQRATSAAASNLLLKSSTKRRGFPGA